MKENLTTVVDIGFFVLVRLGNPGASRPDGAAFGGPGLVVIQLGGWEVCKPLSGPDGWRVGRIPVAVAKSSVGHGG